MLKVRFGRGLAISSMAASTALGLVQAVSRDALVSHLSSRYWNAIMSAKASVTTPQRCAARRSCWHRE